MIQSDIYAFRPVIIPDEEEGQVRIHSRFT